jgi:hypothetical protein
VATSPPTATPAPAVRVDPTARLRVGLYLAVSGVIGLLVSRLPNMVVAPMMPDDTHLMASIGGSSPGYPWTYLGAMGAMLLTYGLILPAAFGVRGFFDGHAKVGVLLAAPLTFAFAAYLGRYALPLVTWQGASGGVGDTLSVVFYLLTPLPLLWAAARLVAVDDLRGKRVLGGAVLLHAGMLLAMAAANIVQGDPATHTMALDLVRWH